MPELRRLNYYNFIQNDTKLNIDPETIPTLIPKATLKEWQDGDTDPYYKIQVFEYPILANGVHYQESFFKSFISKLKERPIPGAKDGHHLSWGERPQTDFIMIGGKVSSNGDGTGKAYFKNYIPKEGNDVFIRENKSDMVHYSLVSYTKDEYEEDENGDFIINAIESIKGERNDAVEYGLGAMEQKTNADSGDSKDKPKEEGNVNKKELLEKLKTLKANAEITLDEIAEALGLGAKLLTKEHSDALKVVNSLAEKGIEKPLEQLEKMQADIKANQEDVRRAKLDTVYGIDEKKENFLRQYAEKQTVGVYGEELDQKINELKEDPIAKKLAQEKADYDSEYNRIGTVEKKENSDDKAANRNGRRVDVL